MKKTVTGGLTPAFATRAVARSVAHSARIIGSAVAFAACALAGASHARAEGLLVPAYIYPSGSGATQWNTLATTAQSVPTTVILNPDSGPGTTQDPNYVAAVAKVHAAGGKVIGYVSTSYANRALSAVVQDIHTYLALYQVDGFFIDEMTADSVTAHVQFYQSVYNYIKGLSPEYTVIGNPGTNVPEIYASLPVADQIVTFEDSARNYTKYAPLAWQANYPASRFAHIVYAASATQMQTFMAGRLPRTRAVCISRPRRCRTHMAHCQAIGARKSRLRPLQSDPGRLTRSAVLLGVPRLTTLRRAP